MDAKYKLSLLIYGAVQILILLYMLMWSLGMSENAKLNTNHYLVMAFMAVNILWMAFLPAFSNKQKWIKNISKSLGIVFLALSLFCAVKLLFEIVFHGMDGGFFAVVFLFLFAVANIYLAKRILKL